MELIIHKSLFSSNFYVDYEGYNIFELWTLSGKGGSRINQGGRAGGTRFFFERVVGYGRILFLWVGGVQEKF